MQVSDKEFDLKYKTKFNTIFEYNQILGGIWFSEKITHRLILYPQIFTLSHPQMMALCNAVSDVGDDEFMLTVLELFTPEHWLIPFNGIEVYYSIGLNTVLENVIFSPKGLWGIKFTMDLYAVVGGSKTFIDNLKRNWPTSIDEQIFDFVNDFKNELQSSEPSGIWLKQLLEHVYGKKHTQTLLRGGKLI